jgi:choline dehydrogenase-like flavoprotein
MGGGSGGCAVASRRSEDSATSVALLAAGGTDDDWAFETVPQKGLNGRGGYQPRGKDRGASSLLNGPSDDSRWRPSTDSHPG